jgi:hypothetical protein
VRVPSSGGASSSSAARALTSEAPRMNTSAPKAQIIQIPPQTIQFVIPIAHSAAHVTLLSGITSSTRIGHMSAIGNINGKLFMLLY